MTGLPQVLGPRSIPRVPAGATGPRARSGYVPLLAHTAGPLGVVAVEQHRAVKLRRFFGPCPAALLSGWSPAPGIARWRHVAP